MPSKYHLFIFKLQHLFYGFLSSKTLREKYLLGICAGLCVLFVMIEFVYIPLFDNLRSLRALYEHTQREFMLSSDSFLNAKAIQLEQMQSLRSELQGIEDELSLIKRYFKEQEPPLNPFMLMPQLIEFAKGEHISLASFGAYPEFNTLSIKGRGEFENILSLLSHIESYDFLSIDFLHLKASDIAIMFEMLIVDHRFNPSTLVSP